MGNSTESTVPGTAGTQNQKSGCFIGKTLKLIGASGFLADRMQTASGNHAADHLIFGFARKLPYQPAGFRAADVLFGGGRHFHHVLSDFFLVKGIDTIYAEPVYMKVLL
jgi:hypothetical protein